MAFVFWLLVIGLLSYSLNTGFDAQLKYYTKRLGDALHTIT